MRRILKWTGIVLAVPILLFLTLSFLLYLPPVQDFAVRKVAAYVSEAMGLDVSVGRLRLRFPLDIDLQDFAARDSLGDTIAMARSLVVDLDLTHALHGRVGVEGIGLTDVQADTKDLIATVRVSGRFGKLSLRDDVDLPTCRVAIDEVVLSRADVAIVLRDTVTAKDTTSTVIPWTIDVGRAEIDASRLRLCLEAASLDISAALQHLEAGDAHIDLGRQRYAVGTFEGRLADMAIGGKTDIRLPDATLATDSIAFDAEAMHLDIAALRLRSASSRIDGAVAMDIKAFTPSAGGRLTASVDARVGREDMAWALLMADSTALAPFAREWPLAALHLTLSADGNVDSLRLTRLDATLPGTLDLQARGAAFSILDAAGRGADVSLNAHSGDMSWLLRAVGADTRTLRLPSAELVAEGHIRGTDMNVKARLDEGDGSVLLQAQASVPDWRTSAMTYDAAVGVRQVDVRHFLPTDSIGHVSATVALSGSGTDIYAATTTLDADVQVSQLVYGRRFDLSGIGLLASVSNGQGRATLTSDNSLMRCRAEVAAMLERRLSGLTFGLDLTSADFYALGITDHPLSVGACFHIDGTTNLSDHHAIDGSINDITLTTADTLFRPEDITLRALLRPDTLHAYVASGDLYVTVDTDKGYERLLQQSSRFTAELQRQWAARRFSLDALRRELPKADVHASVGTANPAFGMLKANGIAFDMANVDFTLSPEEGMNCGGQVYGLKTEGVQLDTVAFFAFQDTTGLSVEARVRNGRRNPQFRFDTRLSAVLTDTGSVARLRYIDERGRTGIDIGLRASIADESLQLSIAPRDPILGYRTFHANADNYLRLLRRNRIETDIKLVSDDGTGLNLYSTPNADALQDLTLGLQHINIGRLISVVPYAPKLTGMLDGDVHLQQHDKSITLSADVTANTLTYETAALGQVGLQAVYLPNADGSHYIDGSLTHDGMPVATIGGTLGKSSGSAATPLDINLGLERFPIKLANGFIPTGDAAAKTPVAVLSGFLMGDVHLGGTTARPDVDGVVHTSDVRIRSDLYSIGLRLDDSDIRLDDSRLTIDSLRFYASGKQPLVMAGTADFARLDRIALDMNVTARNYELINARKTAGALAYGRVYVDCNAMVRGTLNDLRIMGSLKVLPETDATYVLTDSPLSTDDQLAGLVDFVDFSDTIRVGQKPETVRPKHINLIMSVDIADAAQLHCMLSSDGNNYVNIEGGGTLTMTYSPERNLQLNGRYTVNSGKLKYTMMVIPLVEFAIKNGSYVEFRGPIANPHLNLSATERLRTTLTENGQPRSVAFDVGLALTQTLDNMGLEFTIEAPEDMMVQNELASMSAEQRGRVAVTMLATGMYITESTSSTDGGFSGQNALNAFLQSQISNIAGKALKSVDLSLGMEQGTTATGAMTTDYSFRFAKRFWGNRISVIVGGRVSTGQDAVNDEKTIIDNLTIEYRLDKSATRYVNVFYKKNTQSLLDGEVLEMGAGLVLRRKTNRLGELFLFRNKSE